MKKSIYIQIPSYRDKELQPTLFDLVNTANCKEELRIAVAWQHDDKEKLNFDFIKKEGIEIIDIPMEKSRGCNWARGLLQERWLGEPYTLFLDSHHRFVPGWDSQLVEMYQSLKEKEVAKPLITAYLPDYDPKNDPDGRLFNPLKIEFKEREQGLLFYLHSREMRPLAQPSSPIPAHFTSLHFLFTEGKFNEEIVFDPNIYFFADEVAIALRAFTRGYSLFQPHKVLGWHLYERRTTRIPHWHDHPEWRSQYAYSANQLFELFSGRKDGVFGIGSQRSIAAYEEYIGMRLIEGTQRPGKGYLSQTLSNRTMN